MGKQDKLTTGGGNALFEISISVHPGVLADYLLRADGFWFHVRLLVCSLLWVISACVMQISLNEHFLELPLYPLPLTVAYLACRRRPGAALLCSFVCGIVYDSMTFGRLGVSSAILGSIVIAVLYLSNGVDGIGKRFWERCLLLGGGSAFLYVACKLGLYFAFPNGDDVLSMVPRHLLAGTLLCGACLAPIMYSVMDLVEWLLRLKTMVEDGDSKPDATKKRKPASREKGKNGKPEHKSDRSSKDTDEPQGGNREQETDNDGEQST